MKNNPKNSRKNAKIDEKPAFPMRINKYLAWKKHSTRRGADELIEKKQVFLNNRLAVLGDKVNENDNVEVRFRSKQIPYIYIAYNKPKGIASYSSGSSKDVRQVVAIKDIFPVSWLDKDSYGLMILTNDGRITNSLIDPQNGQEKEYVVKTKEPLRTNFKEKMEAGVKIDKEMTGKCEIDILNEKSFKIMITGAKPQHIRRMCDTLFQEVADLKCTRIVNINLGNLAEGSHRPIEGEELKKFLSFLQV